MTRCHDNTSGQFSGSHMFLPEHLANGMITNLGVSCKSDVILQLSGSDESVAEGTHDYVAIHPGRSTPHAALAWSSGISTRLLIPCTKPSNDTSGHTESMGDQSRPLCGSSRAIAHALWRL